MDRYYRLLLLSLFCLFFFTACGRSQPLPGYIEGEYTYISSGVGGALIQLSTMRGKQVKQGDLLYLLDPEPDLGYLNAAKSRLLELEVQLGLSNIQFERQAALYQEHAVSRVAFDEALADYQTKQNQILELKANIVVAEWATNQKTMRAPVSGEVFDTFYRLGERVTANNPVLAILAPENIHVLFYIPEPRLSQIRIGQTIAFGCDGCHGKTRAKITYISPEAEYTPPVIYSKDSRAILVYLVRADMPPLKAVHFHPGQPVDIYLHA